MKKRVLSLILAAAMALSLAVPAFAAEIKSFSDVKPGHWAEEAIMLCVQHGAINGTKEADENGVGEYNPKGTVTLAQFLTVLTRLCAAEYIEGESQSGEHWAMPNYRAAIASGMINETDFPSSNLGKTISREDMSYLLVRAAEKRGEDLAINEYAKGHISDYNSISADRVDCVLQAYSNGLITGFTDGSFGPAGTMTRDQMAMVVCRLMEYLPRENVEFGPTGLDKYLVSEGENKGKLSPEYAREIAESMLKGISFSKSDFDYLLVKIRCPKLPTELAEAGWEMRVDLALYGKDGFFLGNDIYRVKSLKTVSSYFQNELMPVERVHDMKISVQLIGGEGSTMYFTTYMSDQSCYYGDHFDKSAPRETFKADMSSIYKGMEDEIIDYNDPIYQYVYPEGQMKGMLRAEYAKEIAPELLMGVRFGKNEDGFMKITATCPELPKILIEAGWRMTVSWTLEDWDGKILGLGGGFSVESEQTKSYEIVEDLSYEAAPKADEIGNITLIVSLSGPKNSTMSFLSVRSDLTAYRGDWFDYFDSEIFYMDMSPIYAGLK